MSEDQIQNFVNDMMRQYDQNGDGRINRQEAYAICKNLFISQGIQREPQQHEVDQLLQQFDSNRDGVISRQELVDYVRKNIHSILANQ